MSRRSWSRKPCCCRPTAAGAPLLLALVAPGAFVHRVAAAGAAPPRAQEQLHAGAAAGAGQPLLQAGGQPPQQQPTHQTAQTVIQRLGVQAGSRCVENVAAHV
jgi:hypothetical protein